MLYFRFITTTFNDMKAIILIILYISTIYASSGISVKIKVISKTVGESEEVYITGNISLLGEWQPDKVKMEMLNDSTFFYDLQLEKDTSIQFKFTKGSWNLEGLDVNGSIFSNFNYNATKDTTFEIFISGWGSQKSSTSERTIVGDSLIIFKNFEFEGLLPRDIIIWLPKEYKNTTKKYPVIYMHDGYNLFNKETAFGGSEWRVDETIDSLSSIGEITPIIAVGISNTARRSDDYSPDSLGRAYMNLIVKKLKPFIDSNFRTMPDKKSTFAGGSSMGGLISYAMGFEHPEIFGGVICMSPALDIPKYNYEYNTFVETNFKQKPKVKFYIDNGGVDLEEILQPGIDRAIEYLKKLGFEEGKDLYYIVDKTAIHHETAWAVRFPDALKFVLKKD